ncbi:MAG: hypothetical protein GF350_03875 [Chitinivibrionales bacterium]|nr:hypothetical protein [Chitinivibrionales bacterium]
MKDFPVKNRSGMISAFFFCMIVLRSASGQVTVQLWQPEECKPRGNSPFTVTWEFKVLGIAETDTPYFYIDFFIDDEVDLMTTDTIFDTTFVNETGVTEEINFYMWCQINGEGAYLSPIGLSESCWFIVVDPPSSIKYSVNQQLNTAELSGLPLTAYNLAGRKLFAVQSGENLPDLHSSGYFLFSPENKKSGIVSTVPSCEVR